MSPGPVSLFRSGVGLAGHFLILLLALPAAAGTLSGRIVDTQGVPLAGIDIDVLDDRGRTVRGLDAVTGLDGAYTVLGVPEGDYQVRADPTLAQGFVDQYYPGVFLPAAAGLIHLAAGGNVTGIDFQLGTGRNIHGRLTDATTGLPVAGIDLDVLASDLSLLPSIDATSDSLGFYTLGALPPGDYRVRADPTPQQAFVDQYFAGTTLPDFATPVVVSGAADVAGIDLALQPGGSIFGVIRDAATGLPLPDIDLDVFDAATLAKVFIVNATSDVDGSYLLGALPPGNYYVRADAQPVQEYAATWYVNSPDLLGAALVPVAAGFNTGSIDISLDPIRFISGFVLDAASGQPLPFVDLDVLDSLGTLLPQFDAKTLIDGSYTLGPMPPGRYFVRVDPTLIQGYADQYAPGVFLLTQASLVDVQIHSTTLPAFALSPGSTVAGTVVSAQTGLPLAGIDLDLFGADFSFVGGVDATTDAAGRFELGVVPPGTYYVGVDPTVLQGFWPRFFDAADSLAVATPLVVTAAGQTLTADFALLPLVATATPPAQPSAVAGVSVRAYPNPFSGRTTFQLRAPAGQGAQLAVYDLRGRRVFERVLSPRPAAGAELLWDGRDGNGRRLPSGTYLLRLVTPQGTASSKLLLLR